MESGCFRGPLTSTESTISSVLQWCRSSSVNDSISLYSQLNILHQLLDAPAVTFGSDGGGGGGGVPVSMDWDDTSYEARLGVRLSPRDAPYSGYVEATYRAPFDSDGDAKSWSATGGLSYRF